MSSSGLLTIVDSSWSTESLDSELLAASLDPLESSGSLDSSESPGSLGDSSLFSWTFSDCFSSFWSPPDASCLTSSDDVLSSVSFFTSFSSTLPFSSFLVFVGDGSESSTG